MQTTESTLQPVQVRITQYRIARIRAGQAILPFAAIGSIVARRSLHPVAVAVAAMLLLAGLLSFLSARHGFGAQNFSVQNGIGNFGTQLTLVRKRVLRWTLSANVIRLYCTEMSLRLVFSSKDKQWLVEELTAWLGKPITLERRGSQQARAWSLAAAATGLACTIAAFIYQTIALVVLGLPMLIVGLATFGALSQPIARR
jgi:hypothetical protein